MSKSVEKRLAAQTSLTGEEIDRLSGVELNEAVLHQLGWKECDRFSWWTPDGRLVHRSDRPYYLTDQGAALGLLMTIDGPWIEWHKSDQTVSVCTWRDGKMITVVDGPIAECASVLSRAYLKLVNGE